MSASDLAVALGHPADARLVIVHADELGLCHAANDGVYDALRRGIATSASLMVPAPWSREAAARYRGEDVGVQLTINAVHEQYRWGPITQSPSLLDGNGGFPPTPGDLWEHADPAELRKECRAQVERAILWGFDVSHLDVHLDALHARPEHFDVVLDLACEFGLPVRPPAPHVERELGFPLRQLAADEGVMMPDHVVTVRRPGARDALERAVSELDAGVTVLVARPAVDTPELRALTPEWSGRVDDLDVTSRRSELDQLLDRVGATRIDYRPLRDLQRTAPDR
ncbi:MAG: ChbG/HpnK family deacetylase [Actinomycetota bacterium]